MNIYLYDQVANRVTSVSIPSADLTTFGYTDREIAILRPLVAALIDIKDVEDPKLAAERLRSLIWGLSYRMINEGHVRDMRIVLDAPIVLTPEDSARHFIFIKFLYRHNENRRESEGRFILATRSFDAPDYKAVLKL